MRLPSVAILLINCGQIFKFGTLAVPQYFNPNADARAIFNAADRDAELIRIFPHRSLFQRQKITEIYKQLNPEKPLVPDRYVPLRGDPFQDLLFAMTTNIVDMHATFLHAALQNTTSEVYKRLVIDILVVTDSVKAYLVEMYNNHSTFPKPLLETVSATETDDYKDLVHQLLIRHRQPDPVMPWLVDSKKIKETTSLLSQESHHWNNTRTMLNHVLIDESRIFAQYVLIQFSRVNSGEHILEAIDKHILDKSLRFAYKALVNDLMYPPMLMADRIYDNVNERIDGCASNIFIITTYAKTELNNINNFFIHKYGQCICEYLVSKNPTDPVNRMLASMASGIPAES